MTLAGQNDLTPYRLKVALRGGATKKWHQFGPISGA